MIMDPRLTEETLFWIRLAAFAHLSEQILCSGASVADAEEVLFGWSLPGALPATYACLTGGVAYATNPV
jgi:hypothetical protein